MNRSRLAALIFTVGSCTMAHAALQTWSFNNPTGTLGNTQTYTSSPGGIVITAYGFLGTPTAKGAATALFGKNVSGDPTEQGLGTNLGSSNEIDTSHFVELDLHNLTGLTINLTIQSLQGPDAYSVYTSNALGGTFTLVPPAGSTNNNFGPINITAADDYLAVTATSVDVLLSTLSSTNTTSGTPEPRFYGLLLVGMMGLAATIWRKRRVTE